MKFLGSIMYNIISSENIDIFDFFLSTLYTFDLLQLTYYSSYDFKYFIEQIWRKYTALPRFLF